MGYQYADIVNAYTLSVLLESATTKEILQFKPEDITWRFLAEGLISYKDRRRIMQRLNDKDPAVVLTAAGDTTLRSKADVLTGLQGMAPDHVARLKRTGLSEEDILALKVLASLQGVGQDKLAADVEAAAATSATTPSPTTT